MSKLPETIPTLSFPVIRGLQAKREYYVAMWSLRMLRQISIFDEDELPPELRAQRLLNRNRIPEITDYIITNPENYTFSALTVSIDSEINFSALPGQNSLGTLKVPMDARFIINDGQHRRAAIIDALKQRPELENETIAVVFFLDIGLEKSQQMFADLNRYAIRPNTSLGLLYDHRNEKARLAKSVIMQSNLFRDIVDMERSSLSKRSRKLFTLSAFYNACGDLIKGLATGDLESDAQMVTDYWEAVALNLNEWTQAIEGKVSSSELRDSYIHVHGIGLQALGKTGNALLKNKPEDWKKALTKLSSIDWSRNNIEQWEGRAMIGGRISKVSNNVILTTNVIKKTLGLSLDHEQNRIEEAFTAARSNQPNK